MTERELIQKLVDVMRRCDEVWCALNDAKATTDDEWDDAITEAEDWLEDNA